MDDIKEIWKLVYNLANQHGNIKEVFFLVNDILGRNPSILRSFSKNSKQNDFQSSIILWLLNKLLWFLKHSNTKEFHLQNVEVQKKILSICLINCPFLFNLVTSNYVKTIDELIECQLELIKVKNDDDLVNSITLKSFRCEKNAFLLEIAPNFQFDDLEITIDNYDCLIDPIIEILDHALSIGCDAYSDLFMDSMETVLGALRKCKYSIKLSCLNYELHCFNKIIPITPKMEEYLDCLLMTMVILWKEMTVWLMSRYVNTDDINGLIEITYRVYKHLMPAETQNISRKQEHLESACMILLELNTFCNNKTTQHTRQFGKVLDLIDLLTHYLFELLAGKDGKSLVLSANHIEKLNALTGHHLPLLQVLGTLQTQTQLSPEEPLYDYFKNKLTDLIGKYNSTLHDLEFLKNLLEGILYVEFRYAYQEQLEFIRQTDNIKTIIMEIEDKSFSMFSKVNSAWKQIITNKIENFFNHFRNAKFFKNSMINLNIIGLIMEANSIREMLSKNLQQQLLKCLEKYIMDGIRLSYPLKSDEGQLSLLALTRLFELEIKTPKVVYNVIKTIVNNIIIELFKSGIPSQLIQAMRIEFCTKITNFYVLGLVTRNQILEKIMPQMSDNIRMWSILVKLVICTSIENNCIFMKKSMHTNDKYAIVELLCQQCSTDLSSTTDLLNYMEKKMAKIVVIKKSYKDTNSPTKCSQELPENILSKLFSGCMENSSIRFIGNHIDTFPIFTKKEYILMLNNCNNLDKLNKSLLEAVVMKYKDDEDLMTDICSYTLTETFKSLQEINRTQQLNILQIVTICTPGDLNTEWLFYFMKITFCFMINENSMVSHESVCCAKEMCARNNVQPIQLWNWYKQDAIYLTVRLIVYVYLTKGIRLTKSLKEYSYMLGFSCVQEFVCKYYRLLITMILPYSSINYRCFGLLLGITKLTRKNVKAMLVSSFLRLYANACLNESRSLAENCIKFVLNCTNTNIKILMSADVKQTVSEFLIYFNRDQRFVMEAFNHLLVSSTSTSDETVAENHNAVTSEFAKFIADRFLGIITYFENCLAEPNFEKPLKEQALYSLAQIMRFVGSKHVTQFRFKIIAMLSFVFSLKEKKLSVICLKVWNIFVHIVNIRELGPSLSRIVACLRPLLEEHNDEVNSILEYIILNNDSLLGTFIPDLYFIENVKSIKPGIRQLVVKQTTILKGPKSKVLEKLQFLYKQITNENLEVRICGLSYLRNYMSEQRDALNRMVLNEIIIDPTLEKVLDVLIAGCQHKDHNLRMASAKCLGELGAIDPSYMSLNFVYERVHELPLSVHTDAFAIMGLRELCRAYQFQKNTKYVDNFSLAIQETLSVCGVSPALGKKINVWEALPERMRQIMEPLLTSCYTSSARDTNLKEHPIFNSISCRSYEDWAFAFSGRLIGFVQGEETKHLLNSYKPSIKRDNNILALFFPYILLHALLDCTDTQMQQIFEEMETVLNFSSQLNVAPPDYENIGGFKEFNSMKYSADLNLEKTEKQNNLKNFDATEKFMFTCSKLCSEQIDFLYHWIREWQRNNVRNGKVHASGEACSRIQSFLEKFDKHLVASANCHSGEYARALMYLEDYVKSGNAKERLQEEIPFLIKIYGCLGDSDSVEGAVRIKKSNLSLMDAIAVNRIVDRPQDTLNCYEQLLSQDELISEEHIRGMINCYVRMDVPQTALLVTDGLWQKLQDQFTDDYFKESKAELFWQLGRFEGLQELLDDTVMRRKTSNWSIQCAEALMLFRHQHNDPVSDFEKFQNGLDVIRGNVLLTMAMCSVVKQNSYTHSYDEVVKLHLLNEVEKEKALLNIVLECSVNEDTVAGDRCVSRVESYFEDWNARLSIVQPVVRIMEPVLCFRRNLLTVTKEMVVEQKGLDCVKNKDILEKVSALIDVEIGKLWLRSIQINRDSGYVQQAHLSIMKAEKFNPQTLFIEKAKLLWAKGDQTDAFKVIEQNLERILSKCNDSELDPMDRALYAEAKYLQATYNAESMNICAEQNLRYFKEAVAGNRRSEKCHVQLAQYMEKMYGSLSAEQREGENGRKILLDIMLHYAKSLKCGFDNVYHSLPRLLSLWLDFTAENGNESASNGEVTDAGTSSSTKMTATELARKMNDLMKNCATVLPTSIFYSAYSQLLSRICHPSNEVFNVLRTIVIKVVEHFPQQSLWMLLPVYKSTHTNRIKRCKLIFTDPRLAKPQFQKLLNDFNMLAERLIELTNKQVGTDTVCSLSSLVKQLPRLFHDATFSHILLPFEKFMQPSFPMLSTESHFNGSAIQVSQEERAESETPSNPFPYKQIFIRGINEEVTVLRSAAKPKKITIRCDDGKQYVVMMKPKDDLRKDFRLMEFNGLVKRYLHQDPQARQRRLHIRTYAAIPLNEDCGLVEWLPNLDSFRNICTSIYRIRGHGIPDRALRPYLLPRTDPIEKKRTLFVEKLLPLHPPVFHEWIRHRFQTPGTWYEARNSFVKTVAVMSIVGYILGLGDRHGENVLLDEMTGDAVHVDFNCLFNQGECFAYPELVPFRLTHNMVFAMGPLGVEGLFRKCCEITLRILKNESKTLMSVLRPFVYDFVRNYTKKATGGRELIDPKTVYDVRCIEERIQGYVKKTMANSMPLSTEGQVNFLIDEALNIDNLAAMYIGWSAFI